MDRHSRNSASAWHRTLNRRAATGALCAVLTGALVLGFMWDMGRPTAPVGELSRQMAAPRAPTPTPLSPPAAAAIVAPLATRSTVPASGIHRCVDGARVIYADRPCGANSVAVALPAPSAGLQPDRSYAEQLARVRAERARNAAPRPMAQVSAVPVRDEGTRCAAIDASIRQIDATTRQALTVPMAEYYRAQRRALMDERFSIGCNG
ncbi:hypothetical protein [Methyloversatilis thermotolerans]|uniref:hypothetical protein n=1 Tax=Methyloversatilis thermotolerans TaxID=1346290 RepID=UPI000981A80A|nr:hypothetical protein [Methyloversatilis thermotolerans]